ncbi:MAG: galactitol-1-phosphate 5-dehydrogenase [Eubacteriales bacterium]
MKAAVLLGNNNIVYTDIEEPILEHGYAKIKVYVCGVCGSDIPRVHNNAAHNYPLVLGHEFSGEIIDISENTFDLKVGDSVSVAPLIPCNNCSDCHSGNYSLCEKYSFIGSRQQGGLAEYVVVPIQNLVKIPSNLSYVTAALIEPSTVALHALKVCGFGGNKTAVVIGCGIIGIFTIQWLKLLGATKVIAVARGCQAKLAAQKAGADIVLEDNVNDFLTNQVWESYGFASYVFDCVGSEKTICTSLQAVEKKGCICFIGTPKTKVTIPIATWEKILRKECHVTGSWMSYSAPFPGEEWTESVNAFSKKTLKVFPEMISGTHHLESVADVFAQIKEAKPRGRVLFLINECDSNCMDAKIEIEY